MKTAIIVDSACSLPKVLREKYDVSFVPISYSIDDGRFVDECNEENAEAMFESGSLSRKHEVNTQAPSPEDFESAIINKIKNGYQRVIVQTVNRTQGDTYDNANAGLVRAKRQLDGRENIVLRVMDSRTVFAGQGLMAIETIRRLLNGKDEPVVRRQMDKISEKIHTFILPKELLVAIERSRERNETSVGWAQALVANTVGIHPIICNVNDTSSAVTKIWGFKNAAHTLFQHVIRRMDESIVCPIVTVNYCGPISELKALPGYGELSLAAKRNKIMLVPSVASIASGIYTSVGSLSIAIATDAHEWTEKKESKLKASLSGVRSLLRRRDS